MPTIRKFFDSNGKEVDEKSAVKCHEIVVGNDGRVVSEQTYFTDKASPVQFDQEKLASLEK